MDHVGTGTSASANDSARQIAQLEDVAGVIVFLASHQARWVTGQWIHVGGGHGMLPGAGTSPEIKRLFRALPPARGIALLSRIQIRRRVRGIPSRPSTEIPTQPRVQFATET